MFKNKGKIRDIVNDKMQGAYAYSSPVLISGENEPELMPFEGQTEAYDERSKEFNQRADFAKRPTLIDKITKPTPKSTPKPALREDSGIYSRKNYQVEARASYESEVQSQTGFTKTPKMISNILRR